MSDSYGVELFWVDGQIAIFDRGISTGEAYGITQTHDDLSDGCILILPSEGVVGVMIEAWPTAVTKEHGEFHSLLPDAPLPDKYDRPLAVARGVATALEFEIA